MSFLAHLTISYSYVLLPSITACALQDKDFRLASTLLTSSLEYFFQAMLSIVDAPLLFCINNLYSMCYEMRIFNPIDKIFNEFVSSGL